MEKKYLHLSEEERDLIAVLKAKGKSLKEIGEELGRNKSTISRELRRVEHEQINNALGTDSFFCNSYHSWEKGTVENLIGLIRR